MRGRGIGVRGTGACLLALLLAALIGCNAFDGTGDENSREARLEEARIAMDRGDYGNAVPLLQSLSASYPADGEIARALAAAWSGRAGLDLLGLAAQAAAAADNASLSTIGELLETLPNPVDDGNLADIAASVAGWSAVASTPNDYYSLALAQLTQGMLVIVKDTDTDGDGVPDDFGTALEPTISDPDAVTIYGSLADAILNLTDPARAALAPDSDVLQSLLEIKAGMDALSPGEGASADDIRAYLQSELGGAG